MALLPRARTFYLAFSRFAAPPDLYVHFAARLAQIFALLKID